MKGALVFAVAAISFGSPSSAGILDDTDKLKGQYIADVGDLEQIRCPIGGKYDCLTFPHDLYRFNFTRCFQVMGYYDFSGKALLAVDAQKRVSMFVMPSGLGRDIKQFDVVAYECPDRY